MTDRKEEEKSLGLSGKSVELTDLGITKEEALPAIGIAHDPFIPPKTIKRDSAVAVTLKKMMNAEGPIVINFPNKK